MKILDEKKSEPAQPVGFIPIKDRRSSYVEL